MNDAYVNDAYVNDAWSLYPSDNGTALPAAGDFGMLRPWEPRLPGERWLTENRAIPSPHFAGVAQPDGLEETSGGTSDAVSDALFGMPLPMPLQPLVSEHIEQVRLWRSRSVPPVTSATHSSPGVALTQMVTQMATNATHGEREPIIVTPESWGALSYPLAEDTYFCHNLAGMVTLTHTIVNCVITNQAECDVYAGFQRFSTLEAHEQGVRALLGSARHVYAYGLNDMQEQAVLAHPRLLRFAIQPQQRTLLEWLWFVVVDDPRLRTALVAQQVSGSVWPGADAETQATYAGFWTFNPVLVRQIVTILQSAGRALYFDRQG